MAGYRNRANDMNAEPDRLDQLVAGMFPLCQCEWCTAARQDNLTTDLNKKYGTTAAVLQRLAGMD